MHARALGKKVRRCAVRVIAGLLLTCSQANWLLFNHLPQNATQLQNAKVRGRASKVRERRAIGARLDHVGYRQPVHAAHTERCASIGFTL